MTVAHRHARRLAHRGARLPTAVSLPDAVFEALETCARRLQLPVQSLLAAAVWDFLVRHRRRSAPMAVARPTRPGDDLPPDGVRP